MMATAVPCTILVDGKAVKSCSMLIGQIRNKKVITIEGVSDGDVLSSSATGFC